MKKLLVCILAAALFQAVSVRPAYAGQDSTKVEHDKQFDFTKEVVLDDTDRQILIEYGAIWEPFSLGSSAAPSPVKGILGGGGVLRLEFASPLGPSRLEVYRGGALLGEWSLDGTGDAGVPLGPPLRGAYVFLLFPEDEPGACHVGRLMVL